jgi:superfamily I DNA/RNA helicase
MLSLSDRYVVLDEIQDLTEDLYWVTNTFVSAVTCATGRAPQILILGDARQVIYEFRGADARYLDLAPSVFSAVSPYNWDALALSKSFRLSQETASFVNHAFLGGEQYIEGMHRGGPKPLYVHANLSDIRKLLALLVPLIQKYGPENTAILAPSIRNNPRLPPLTNALSTKYGIPVAVSTADDVPLDADVIHGKVIVSTYHQFKGSEWDFVVVYGADSGYFSWIGRDLPDDRCPNATFVALTRARKQVGCPAPEPLM